MLSKIVIFVVVATFQLSHAQEVFDGPCPELSTVSDFNMTRYLGMWYEISRYENLFEPNVDCVLNRYTEWNNSFIGVHNSNKILPSNETKSYEGYGKEVNPSLHDGKLVFNYETSQVDRDYWVMGINYDAWNVGWACYYSTESNRNFQYLYIKSRDPTLDSTAEIEVNALLETLNLDVTKLRTTEQGAPCY